MAASSQSQRDGHDIVPLWKRELISRRRALARHLPADGQLSVQFTCPPVVAAVRHPNLPVPGQSSVDVSDGRSSCGHVAMRVEGDSDRRTSSSSHHGVDPVRYRLLMGEQKTKGATPKPALELDMNGHDFGGEELAYGPGIVKRLKSKYLSMTLRENKARGVRPSIQNMRRAASLEDLVDGAQETGSVATETTAVEIRPRFAKRQEAVVAGGNARFRSGSRGNESIKRARSVEALLRYDANNAVAAETRTLHKSLSRDEIVIVEKSAVAVTTPVKTKSPKKRPSMNNGLPPSDVVKTTLRLFETRGNAKAAPLSGKPLPGKPLLSPKPSPEKLRRANPLAVAMAKKAASTESVAMVAERRAQLLSPVTVEVHELPTRALSLDLKPVVTETKGIVSHTSSSPRQLPPVSPFQRPHSPVAKQTSPVARQPSPVVKLPSPIARQPSPISPVAKQPSPVSPVLKQPSPISPVAKQPSPVSPVPKQPSPISPVAKQPSPFSPVAKQPPPVSPVAKQPSPISPFAKQPSPVSPVPKQPSPVSPVAKQPSPASPVAKQPPPVSPVAKERTPSPLRASLVANGNEVVDGVVQKAVSSSALDAIRKAGHPVELSFKTSESNQHLPGASGAVCSDSAKGTAPDVPTAPTTPSASSASKGPSVAVVPKVPSASSASKGPSVAMVEKVPSAANASKVPGVVIVPKVPPVDNVPKSPGAAKSPAPPVPKATPVSFPEKRAPMSPLPELTSPNGSKQVGVIRPILAQTPLSGRPMGAKPTPAEAKKNLINSGKCEKVVASLKPSEIVVGNVSESLKNGGLWDAGTAGGKRPWHQPQTTVKYNFRDRKEVPSHVHNDGMVLPKTRTKIRPGESGYVLLHPSLQEASTDSQELDDVDVLGGFAGPPSPCNVLFEGDNVLINGRSNLRTRPKQTKLRITFDDAALQLFEYPSESSLLSDTTPSDMTPAPSGAPPTVPATGTPLANYTSKTALADFELGVTRTTPTPRPREAAISSEETMATEENNVAWSHTANDHLMF